MFKRWILYVNRRGVATHSLIIEAESYLSLYKAAYRNKPTPSHDVSIFNNPPLGHFSGTLMGTIKLEY